MPQAVKITITPLKRYRFLAGLKANAVARRIGHTPWWMTMAEAGSLEVPALERRRLARIIGVPVSVLFPPKPRQTIFDPPAYDRGAE